MKDVWLLTFIISFFLFAVCVDRSHVAKQLPYVIRDLKISLKDEHTKKIFRILEGQESTDLDLLFIDAPSPLGHEAKLNYYAEIELQQRDATAFQRVLEFSGFCRRKGIHLFPILVTNMRESGYVENVCVLNMNDLRKTGVFYERYMDAIEWVPGLAYDDAASCFYVLELLSRDERVVKEKLLEKLRSPNILMRKTLDFKKFVSEDVPLGDCLEWETTNNFNQRMVEYIKKLKGKELLKDTSDGRAHQLTLSSGKLILKWRSGV